MATKRPRSPKYPRLSLRKAIEQVEKVYQSERTHRVSKLAVAKDLGYGSLNGASVGLIGTLKGYGLLHEDKDGVRVTEDTVTILRAPEGHPDKAEAVQRAAFAPRIFNELRNAYGDDPSGLPGETALRYDLEKRGFLEKAADEVIRTYRDNLEFVSDADTEYTTVEMVDEQPVEAQMQPQTTVDTPTAPHHGSVGALTPTAPFVEQGSFTESLEIRVSGDSKVRLLFDGVVTKEAIRKLVKYLQLAEDDYPSKAEVEQPAIEQPTEPPAIEMPAPE